MNLVKRLRNSKRRSGQVAKDRLRTLVSLDRASISPGKLQYIERDIAQVVRHHLGVDPDQVEVEISGRGRDVRLDARVSLRRTAA